MTDAEEQKQDALSSELPGAILRREREARGLSIREIASELHVGERLLDALEKDDYDTIGAPIFVKGHLRNYAKLLGLDGEPLVHSYEDQAAVTEPKILVRQGDGTPMEAGSGGPWLKVLGWVLITGLLLGSLGWWYYQQESAGVGSTLEIVTNQPELELSDSGPATDEASGQDDPRARIAADQPAGDSESDAVGQDGETTDPASGETGSVMATPVEPAATTGGTEARPQQDETSEPAAVVVEPGRDDTASGGTVEAPVQSTAPAGVAGEGSEPAAVTAAPGSMEVRFNEASWIEVYNDQDEPLLYDLVPAGQSREVSAAGELRVFLGNAPAVSISVNGEAFDLARYVRRDNTARFRVNVSQGQ